MNGNEKLYEAITGLGDEIVERAGEYKPEKKKRSLAWIGYAAAACAAVAVGLGLVIHFAGRGEDPDHQAAVPTEQMTIMPTEDNRRVISAKSNGPDEFYPNVGQMFIEYSLEDAINDPENEDCLFDAEIRFCDLEAVSSFLRDQFEAYKDNRISWEEYEITTDPSNKNLITMKENTVKNIISALAEKGYELEQNGMKAHGLLTREQILEFPTDDCGVLILWAGYEGGLDE
ncbi:MAG: hypothetical protein K6G56_00020 [Clostridiales bacterium]|nr:hypothetical protein [Clostridiales bacterium]